MVAKTGILLPTVLMAGSITTPTNERNVFTMKLTDQLSGWSCRLLRLERGKIQSGVEPPHSKSWLLDPI
jgi:hypothetical protein